MALPLSVRLRVPLFPLLFSPSRCDGGIPNIPVIRGCQIDIHSSKLQEFRALFGV